MKKLIITLLCLAILSGGGWFGYSKYKASKDKKKIVDVVPVSMMAEPADYYGMGSQLDASLCAGDTQRIFLDSTKLVKKVCVKEGDSVMQQKNASNRTELLFFTDRAQVYKTRASAFDDTKASVLGDFVPVKLGFDEGERVKHMIATEDYSGHLLFCFENGKIAKVPLSAYATKTNRKKLANAYSDKSPLVQVLFLSEDSDILLRSSNSRAIVFHSAMLLPKTTRDSIGVQVMTLKAKGAKVEEASLLTEEQRGSLEKYIVKNIPAAGCMAKDLEIVGQMTL